MFDWEDQQITSIIWGKEGHIVQYPPAENSKVSAANVKITRNTTESKNIITDLGQGNNTRQYYIHGRPSADTQLASKAKKLAHETTDEFFDNEAEEKDGGNFVDYGWANVGSFDDLDRIISNYNLELWSSTKDVIGCPEMSSIDSPSLDSKSNFGTKTGVIKNENTHKKFAEMNKQRQGQLSKVSSLQLVRNQETDSFGHTNFIDAFPSPRGYNMMINQHSAGSASTHQQVSSSGKTRDTALSMTPQEKIEKLRRRQQMRALLAIRKQQQEIRQQDDYSNLELCSQKSHMQFPRAGSLVSLEQSDSDARSVMMDKTAVADSVVHQFQNVIASLGIQMRLCIRDSLLRLAKGALHRKNDGTTNKISNDGLTTVVMEGASNTKSLEGTRDGETKTNPLDRVVARLLFYSPPGELVQSLLGASKATTTATMKFHKTANDSQLETEASSL